MTWIMDTYKYLHGESQINAQGCATGKKLSQGGIAGRTESTGLGCFYVLRELLEDDEFCDRADISSGVKGKKVIVQGFGNVGYNFAKYMHREGAKIVGIVEKDAAIFSSSGLNPDDVRMHMSMSRSNSLSSYPHADEVQTDDPAYILRKKCDILAPCASDGAINKYNAAHLKCKVLLEGANGPTTFAADKILTERGIVIIPDLLANVGGVTVSYFEWLKNLDHVSPGRMKKKYSEKRKSELLELLGYKIPENSPLKKKMEGAKEIDIVYAALADHITKATRENWSYAVKKNVTLREACIGSSLTKMADRFKETGMMI